MTVANQGPQFTYGPFHVAVHAGLFAEQGIEIDETALRAAAITVSSALSRDTQSGLPRQPEMVVGTWQAARATAPDITEQEVRLALERIEPLLNEAVPAERARIVQLLVDRGDVRAEGAAVGLRLELLGSLVRDLGAQAPEAGRAAASARWPRCSRRSSRSG